MSENYHKLLPPMAIDALKRAAATPTKNDRLARQKEIERVTTLLKRQFPEHFR